eukprot:5020679-Amphidinium_carterae.1
MRGIHASPIPVVVCHPGLKRWLSVDRAVDYRGPHCPMAQWTTQSCAGYCAVTLGPKTWTRGSWPGASSQKVVIHPHSAALKVSGHPQVASLEAPHHPRASVCQSRQASCQSRMVLLSCDALAPSLHLVSTVGCNYLG